MTARNHNQAAGRMTSLREWRASKFSLWLLTAVLVEGLAFTAPVFSDELVRVKRVFDGDTILLEDGRKVRYLGINAPEFQEPFYLKAKRFNESLVLEQELRLEFDQEQLDRYDRLLAYVFVGDQLVNARLVEQGLAHAFFIGPRRKYNDLLIRLQSEAKRRKAGIWSARAATSDLKITNVHLADPTELDPYAPYVRLTNLSSGPVQLAGYALLNERGGKYLFPGVTVEPGYTVIVASKEGTDSVDSQEQLVLHWPEQNTVWDPKEDTAFLLDPSGVLVDKFHYKGKRVTKSLQGPRGKTPPGFQ